MGADWFCSEAFYGYEITIPDGCEFCEYLGNLYNKFIIFGKDKPINNAINIHAVNPEVHDRMHDGEYYGQEYITVVLGFQIDRMKVSEIAALAEELEAYVSSDECKGTEMILDHARGACVISASNVVDLVDGLCSDYIDDEAIEIIRSY